MSFRPLLLGTSLAILAAPAVSLAEENPFGPIYVAANRAQYTGRGCPIEVMFTGTINFVLPHTNGLVFNYHWERSDGAHSPQQVVRVPSGQRSMVVHEKWRLGGPGKTYDAGATLFVNSGNTHLNFASPSVHIVCY